MGPLRLFRVVAVTEAVTWALLLGGMVLKYGTDTTDVGVKVAGPIHGVAFLAYCLTTLLVAVDQRWTPSRTVLGLLASIPPFFTLVFDVVVERRGGFAAGGGGGSAAAGSAGAGSAGAGTGWRLTDVEPVGGLERPVAWLLRHPGRGAVVGVLAVAVLTGVALAVGPPGGG